MWKNNQLVLIIQIQEVICYMNIFLAIRKLVHFLLETRVLTFDQERQSCTLPYVHSSFAIIVMGKRKLVALLSLSSWCLVNVVWLYLAVPWACLQFVIVVFPDHTHLLF